MSGLNKRVITTVIVTFWLAAIGPDCSAGFLGRDANVEGRVIDIETRTPLAGAYVLAVYKKAGSAMFAHSASWCTKTRGMYTRPDGKFSFPNEKDASIHLEVTKPGYVENFPARSFTKRHWYGGELALLPDLFLERRGVRPEQRAEFVLCERPDSPAEVLANIEYLKLLHIEYKKYEPNRGAEGMDDYIRLLLRKR